MTLANLDANWLSVEKRGFKHFFSMKSFTVKSKKNAQDKTKQNWQLLWNVFQTYEIWLTNKDVSRIRRINETEKNVMQTIWWLILDLKCIDLAR